MIARSGVVRNRVLKCFSAHLLSQSNALQDRAIAVTGAADVVHRGDPRVLEELPKGIHQIVGMNVVPNLFPAITVDCVGTPNRDALYKICQETMQFCSGMSRTGQASRSECRRLHAKVTAILLYQDVGCNLAGSKKAVLGFIDGHRLVDAVFCKTMAWIQFPS